MSKYEYKKDMLDRQRLDLLYCKQIRTIMHYYTIKNWIPNDLVAIVDYSGNFNQGFEDE